MHGSKASVTALINQNFNEEGRKAGTELVADLFPAFLLS
jgi:hypothetical protein